MEAVMQFPWVAPRKILSFGYRGGTLALCLVLALALMGCPGFANFVQAAEEDMPVVIQMVTNITNIVAPGVSAEITAAGALVLTSFQIVCGTPAVDSSGKLQCAATSLVGVYKTAAAADRPGILGKIQAALQAASSQIQNIIGLAKGLAGTIGNTIITAISVALSTITLLISIIPVAVAHAKGQAKVSVATKANVVPRAKEIKAQFNQIVIGAGYPQAAIA